MEALEETVIPMQIDGVPIQLRFSSSPIFPAPNFHAVLRILVAQATRIPPIHELGYTPPQVQAIESMLTGSSGMVILCGPTNSGKSTTLRSMAKWLYELRGPNIKILTVEDPVEYIIPGACQVSVPRKVEAGKRASFQDFILGALRQDPDVVIVGEIRDEVSAAGVKDLVLAGRKVLTTLHTYSALWTFIRLREIKVPSSLLAMPGFISGIIYQRLLPKLCPECREPASRENLPTGTAIRLGKLLGGRWDGVFIRGKGCPACKGRGVVGRLLAAEFFLPDEELLLLLSRGSVREGDFSKAFHLWLQKQQVPVAQGVLGLTTGVTALSHAVYHMLRGEVSPLDVESQVAPLDQEVKLIRRKAAATS